MFDDRLDMAMSVLKKKKKKKERKRESMSFTTDRLAVRVSDKCAYLLISV